MHNSGILCDFCNSATNHKAALKLFFFKSFTWGRVRNDASLVGLLWETSETVQATYLATRLAHKRQARGACRFGESRNKSPAPVRVSLGTFASTLPASRRHTLPGRRPASVPTPSCRRRRWPRPGSRAFLGRRRAEAVHGGENSPAQADMLLLLLDDRP